MERDDIIRMAREADLCPWVVVVPENEAKRLERFAALVAIEKDKQIAFLKDSHDAIRELAYKTGAEEEREACARLCETEFISDSAESCAAAIRWRGEK